MRRSDGGALRIALCELLSREGGRGFAEVGEGVAQAGEFGGAEGAGGEMSAHDVGIGSQTVRFLFDRGRTIGEDKVAELVMGEVDSH